MPGRPLRRGRLGPAPLAGGKAAGGAGAGAVPRAQGSLLAVSIFKHMYTHITQHTIQQQLLFLDEGTSALDQESDARLLGSVLASRRRATGMAVVATGHGGRLAAYHDRVIDM